MDDAGAQSAENEICELHSANTQLWDSIPCDMYGLRTAYVGEGSCCLQSGGCCQDILLPGQADGWGGGVGAYIKGAHMGEVVAPHRLGAVLRCLTLREVQEEVAVVRFRVGVVVATGGCHEGDVLLQPLFCVVGPSIRGDGSHRQSATDTGVPSGLNSSNRSAGTHSWRAQLKAPRTYFYLVAFVLKSCC